MILDTVSSTAATLCATLFGLLATGGVADTAVRITNQGHGLLAEAGLSPEGQYGVAGVAGAVSVVLGKIIISYHERMLADRQKQIEDGLAREKALHERIRELERNNDDQARAVLKAGLENFDTKSPSGS